MNKAVYRSFTPVLILFFSLTILFFAAKSLLNQWHVSQPVLIGGNAFLFVITVFSFFLAAQGIRSSNPHAFLRSVYASIMVKLFACIIAAFIYISRNKGNLNKPALFTCMGLYLVYTFTEVSSLMRLLKRKA